MYIRPLALYLTISRTKLTIRLAVIYCTLLQGEFFTSQHSDKYSCREIQKDRHRSEVFAPFLRTFRFFPSIVTGTLQALLGGARRKRGKKKKKVYKIFKSTETSPIACGNKFPLTFYFRFVRNGSRMERCTNERWGRRKKNCKKRKKDVRWLKCRRGTSRNISTTDDDLFVRRRNCRDNM